MADYELLDQNGQPRYILKRVRYFDNQLLVDQDFIDDQRYHIDRHRRHERLLHAPGICDGLTLTPDIGFTVAVSPGAALDALGRQLLVDVATPYTVTREGDLRLYLRYQEQESDASSEDTGVVGNTRFLLRPEINAVEEAALPPYAIVLGTVRLTLEGVEVSTEGRQYAGVRLPAPEGAASATLRSAGEGASDTAALAGALTVSSTITGAMLSTKNSSTGEGKNGVRIDRSAADREASLRFATTGVDRWSLKLDGDSTEHLRLASTGGPGTVQSWDQATGATTFTGDVSIQPGTAWLAGVGTVHRSTAAGETAVLVGTGTAFQDVLRAGDALLLSGDATTATSYTIEAVRSQTELVLDREVTPVTAGAEYTFTYHKRTRKVRFTGAQSAMLELNGSAGSDRGFLLFQESSTIGGDADGAGRLTLGVYRDEAGGEALDIQGGHTLILNAGTWDDALEAAVGEPDRTGDAATLSLRVDNDEKVSIGADGTLKVGDGYAGSTGTLLSVGPGGKATVDSAGKVVAAGGMTVGTGTLPLTVDTTGAITGASGLTVGSGTSKFSVDSKGSVTAATGISSSGTVTLSGLGAGSTGSQFVRRGTDNTVTTTSSVDLSSADVSGTLPFSRGGTGASHFTPNGVVIGTSDSALSSTEAVKEAVLVTSSLSVPGLAQTLPLAVQGNITKVGALIAGSITSGFGSIATTTLNATTAVQTAGTTRIDASGNLTNIAAITAGDAVTLTGLGTADTGTKFLRLNASNKVAATASVDLSSGDVTSTLPLGRGGTGATTFTGNGIVIGGGTALSTTAAAADSVLVTAADKTPSLAQTLPATVQGNITKVGALVSGSIASGFGSIATTTLNATTAVQTGGTTRIDASGNLTNIAAITASTATLTGLGTADAGTKFLRLNATNGIATTTSVSLASGDVTGTLPLARGGTGTTTLTSNGIVIGGSAALSSTAAAADSVLVTATDKTPGLSQTLPSTVQGNITKVGTLTSGSIGAGFGTISTTTLNASTALQTGGTTRIDASGAISGSSLTVTGALSGGAISGTSLSLTGEFSATSLSAATLNATTGLQTGGTTRVDASGNLTNIGTFYGTGLATIKNSTAGDGVGGVFLDRSATDREANLRFATNGSTRWYLQLDNDSTEHLWLSSSYLNAMVQKWDYNTGASSLYGDLNLERTGGWTNGVGTVKMHATATDKLTGTGTSFSSTLQVGDELGINNVTMWVKQVNSDTEVTLTAAVSGLTSGTSYGYGIKKYTRRLKFGSTKTSLIEFNSVVNSGSDKGFILWKEDSNSFVNTRAESSRLSIGVYNDIDSGNGETLDLQGAYMLVLNAGDWDSDLDLHFGTQGGSNPYGLSFRVNNTEHMHIDSSGHVQIRQNSTDEALRITGNGSTDSFYTLMRNESSGYFSILRYNGSTLKASIYLDDSSNWVKTSDRSLKENIVPIDGALDRLMQLRPVSFDWRAGGTRSLGFVAQDVEQVFPELVGSTTVSDGATYKTLSEGGLTPVAIAALQEMKQQFEQRNAALEARNAALEAGNAALEARLAALEALVARR